MSWQKLVEQGKAREALEAMREAVGCPLMQGKALLERFDGDVLLAAGFSLYQHKAVMVRRPGMSPIEAHDSWAVGCAEGFKSRHDYIDGKIVEIEPPLPTRPRLEL